MLTLCFAGKEHLELAKKVGRRKRLVEDRKHPVIDFITNHVEHDLFGFGDTNNKEAPYSLEISIKTVLGGVKGHTRTRDIVVSDSSPDGR